jgi:hypothetical protein
MTGALRAPGRAVGCRQYLMRPATLDAPLGPTDNKPCTHMHAHPSTSSRSGGKVSIDHPVEALSSSHGESSHNGGSISGCPNAHTTTTNSTVLTTHCTSYQTSPPPTAAAAAAHLWLHNHCHMVVLIGHIQTRQHPSQCLPVEGC